MQTLDLLKLPLAGSALIEASAGTGKTYTIAALYLRLVLGRMATEAADRAPLLPPQILVVTFTDAATSELKGRIRTRLADAARYFNGELSVADPFLQQLANEFPPSQWGHCAAQLALAAQWMDDAAISTIHSWCYRMLTEHAFDSGAAFDLQLDTDLSTQKQQVVADYWRSFIYPLALDDFQLLRQKLSSPTQLLQMLLPMWQQTSAMPAQQPAELLQFERSERQRQLAALKAPFAHWITELAQIIAQGRANGLTINTKLRADWVERWLAALQQWVDHDDLALPEMGAGLQRLTPQGMADAWKGTVPEHPVFQAIANLPQAIAALPNALVGIQAHALAWCQQRFAAIKSQQGVLGFDDLLTALASALASANGEKLAMSIRQQFPFALIDEFQDTDPTQLAIFDEIYQLSAQRQDCGILLIGDPKQAIYGFRGADIYTYLAAKAKTAGRHFSLDTNFRSTDPMVKAVNAIFGQAESREAGKGAFLFRGAEFTLDFLPVKANGRKEQLQWQQSMAPLAIRYLYTDDGKPLAKNAYLSAMAQVCAREIALLLNAGQQQQCGFQSSEHFQPLQPRDIAILVNNQHEADTIRSALAKAQIRSVYLSDKGSVYQSQMAADLWLWLDACAQPRNHQKIRSALATASFAWSYQQLARLQDDEWFMEQQLELFWQYQQIWQKAGVLPLLRRLMTDFQIPEQLAQLIDGERRLTDLLHLGELLQQASRTLEGEQALLRFFAMQRAGLGPQENDAAKLHLESDEELVRVVTIHKSKGLEYPLVFLPFICAAREVDPKQLPYRYFANGQYHFAQTFAEDSYALACQQRLAEDLRKLYVALTRAQHYCWLGIAALKELSALGYLIAEDGLLNAAQLPAQLTAWLSAPEWPHYSLQQVDAALPIPMFLQSNQQQPLAEYQRMPARSRVPWWTASYSAIASGAEEVEQKSSEIFQELEGEHAVPALEQNHAAGIAEDFIRGARAGTFLHDALEWACQQGFGLIAKQPQLLADYLIEQLTLLHWLYPTNQGYGRRFLRSEQAQSPWFSTAAAAVQPLLDWLLQLMAVPLTDDGATLTTLTQCKAELEFWLSADKVSTRKLDELLQQYLWPGQARPELEPKLVNGMLKGFIDLSFMQQDKYYVADYKSNFVESGRYETSELVSIMLEKRYDLQAACYGLALHRLLLSRKANYDPSCHLGPAIYWFLRGCEQRNHGVLTVELPLALITAMDELFRGLATSAGRAA